MIKRRDFMSIVGGAAATWPLAARAQQVAVPVIGFLSGGSAGAYALNEAGFRKGLNEAGFVEGQNVAIDHRWAEGQYDRLPSMATELLRRQVALIFADALPGALAAKAATRNVPIVFMIGDDPVKFGLVASLNRPGGNLTGVSFLSPAIEAKRVGLLHELAPKANTIAVLVNPAFPAAEVRVAAVRDAASALGLQLTVYNTTGEHEIETAFAAISALGVGSLIVSTDPLFTSQRKKIVDWAAKGGLPAVYFSRQFTTAGGLMSYGSDIPDAYRQAAVYVGRILKGGKPTDLPIQQPTKFELVINLKTAKTLGLEIPPNLLALADEVIE